MGALWANVGVAAAILLTGVSLLLATVGATAYIRLGHKRLLWVAVAFVLFAFQGAWLAQEAYVTRGDGGLPVLEVLGLAIVASLYLAVLKR